MQTGRRQAPSSSRWSRCLQCLVGHHNLTDDGRVAATADRMLDQLIWLAKALKRDSNDR